MGVQWLIKGSHLLFYPRLPFVHHDSAYDCHESTFGAQTSPRPHLGLVFLTLGSIFELVYLVVFGVFWRTFDRTNGSSLLIIANSIYDIGNIFAGGILTGFFLLNGYVYCTNANLVWFCGCLALGCWNGSCITGIALAWYRYRNIKNMDNSNLSRRVRLPRSAVVWIAMSIILFVVAAFFSRPPLFNTELATAVYDPRIDAPGYTDNWNYNYAHFIVNLISPVLTALFYMMFINQVRMMTSCSTAPNPNHDSHAIYYSTLVCTLKMLASFGFIAVQFFNNEWLNITTSLAFLLTSFSSCFVLIVFNGNVRKNILDSLPRWPIRKSEHLEEEYEPAGMTFEMTQPSHPAYQSTIST